MNKTQMEQVVSLQTKANDAYYGWIRHMMALATGELTALIALQDQFVPEVPRHLWSLSATWISLASALVLGGIVLYGEYDVAFRLGKELLEAHRGGEQSERHPQPVFAPPSTTHKICARFFPIALVASLVLLCLFAVANLGNR